jgi:catechol 2,3-dioxygenase-like lactoylglutathione lyase family enzyme
MIRTHGLTHVALAVRDVERAFRFYQEVFGAVAVYREEGFLQAQTPGSRDVLVFEEDAERAGQAGGVAHLGFRLVDPADIKAAAEAMRRAGGTVVEQGEFCPGEPYLLCTDPDGYTVEIWYELPTPVDPPDRPQTPEEVKDLLGAIELDIDVPKSRRRPRPSG